MLGFDSSLISNSKRPLSPPESEPPNKRRKSNTATISYPTIDSDESIEAEMISFTKYFAGKIRAPAGAKNTKYLLSHTKSAPNTKFHWDSRTAVEIFSMAYTKGNAISRSDMRKYKSNFDNKDNIAKLQPCGQPAVTEMNGEYRYLAGSNVFGIWGNAKVGVHQISSEHHNNPQYTKARRQQPITSY